MSETATLDPVAFLRATLSEAIERGERVSVSDAIRLVDALDRLTPESIDGRGPAWWREVAAIPDDRLVLEAAKVRRPVNAPEAAFRALDAAAAAGLARGGVRRGPLTLDEMVAKRTAELREEAREKGRELARVRRELEALRAQPVQALPASEEAARVDDRPGQSQAETGREQLGAAPERRALMPGIDVGWPDRRRSGLVGSIRSPRLPYRD